MTSSLVGSEMCIRDSYLGPLAGGPLAHMVEDQEVQEPSLSFESCLADTPVSYTHLTLPTICSV
eukprot:11161529-Prorocentrum_lima.AAC.1